MPIVHDKAGAVVVRYGEKTWQRELEAGESTTLKSLTTSERRKGQQELEGPTMMRTICFILLAVLLGGHLAWTPRSGARLRPLQGPAHDGSRFTGGRFGHEGKA